MTSWISFIRPGDWVLVAVASAAVGLSLPALWQGGFAERAIIRQEGRIVADVDLHGRRELQVPGPLGTTQIMVEPGRARVVADPGPRQYCVRQGWLSRPGEIAICAPNRVSLQIIGRTKAYDSLSY